MGKITVGKDRKKSYVTNGYSALVVQQSVSAESSDESDLVESVIEEVDVVSAESEVNDDAVSSEVAESGGDVVSVPKKRGRSKKVKGE